MIHMRNQMHQGIRPYDWRGMQYESTSLFECKEFTPQFNNEF